MKQKCVPGCLASWWRGAFQWVQIADLHGRVVTVIKVLSPTNKGDGRLEYLMKRKAYVNGGASVVEIDLLRAGRHSLAISLEDLQLPQGTSYISCVSRAGRPRQKEVYISPLTERLPDISVPLRSHEADIVLQLQPLLDCCCRMGSCWNVDHQRLPAGPALIPEENTWLMERVKTGGLG